MDVIYATICSFLLAIVRMMIVRYTIFENSDNGVHDSVTSDHSFFSSTTGEDTDEAIARHQMGFTRLHLIFYTTFSIAVIDCGGIHFQVYVD